jgi:dGTPase
MSWIHLLDETRIRKALDGKESVRANADARTEFERDRDRTVYSNPVRRLIGKTQVFPLDPNDHVRTRLVHSLEVSTVAEGLASQAVRTVILPREDSLRDDQARAISKIAETCGLLHDLGNPPFGHAGELAIQSWFGEKLKLDANNEKETERFFFALDGPESQKSQDFRRFEGNAQTMRILTNTHLLEPLH